jgi:TorA maturation chaperone TorD
MSLPMTRADLYHLLAEALADPSEWLACAGREWPLLDSAANFAPKSDAMRRAIEALAEVRAESLTARRKRYAALFVGTGRPVVWLYESAFLTGRILGPETLEVERVYRAAGVEPIGAELADHVSLELAFLAQLAMVGQDNILPHEKQFIKQHAGRWLPELGRTLARSGDEVYGPIGQLLAAVFALDRSPKKKGTDRRPSLQSPAECTLCGFCVQVCPTRALSIHETHTETALMLNAAACIGCGKCERPCETHVMKCEVRSAKCEVGNAEGEVRSAKCEVRSAEWAVLRQSPRVMCPSCGEPTVSRAEFEYVAAQIGEPAWLAYCLDCRSALLEKSL